MYKEIISLKRREDKDKKNLFSWIDWYYFGVFAFFLIPKLFLRRILIEHTIDPHPQSLLYKVLYDYHNLISYSLFVFGILMFVLSLQKG